MTLNIYTENSVLRELLRDRVNSYRTTDSGFDIPMLGKVVNEFEISPMVFDLNIKIAATDQNDLPRPCLLLPRSSLSGSPFRLANSIGLIDMGYRGNVLAKVDIIRNIDQRLEIPRGTRYFQLCRNNFMPWSQVNIVEYEDMLPPAPDNRGEGGFGSTGVQ